MKLSASAIRRYCYCPRWYKIHYIIGFQPRSPIKAKFPLGDALHKVMLSKNKEDFVPRVTELVSTETLVEGAVPLSEMVARGLLLCDDALKWVSQFTPVLQEKGVEFITDGHTFWGYPDLYATKDVKKFLIDYKLSYEKYSEVDAMGEGLTLYIYRQGLKAIGHEVNEQYIASMTIRDRKERYSARTRTPLTEVIMVPVQINEYLDALIHQTIVDIAGLVEKQIFPATGIRHGICGWCPMSQQYVMDKPAYCHMPDDVLKELSQTSLQKVSLEKWRDEM
jgi:hypothetical protein